MGERRRIRYRRRRENILLLGRGGDLRMVRNGVKNPVHQSLFHKKPWWHQRRLVAALLHFYGNGLAGRDESVVFRGTGHSDLVRPSAQALKRPLESLLILIIHVHV